MFPLHRSKVEYSETEIGAILDHFVVPTFQRTKNEDHVNYLYENIKAYYQLHHDIMCTGSISLAKFDTGTDWGLLDGQHRVRALQKVSKEFPEITKITIRTDIYTVQSISQMETLYRIINETKKVDLFRTSVELNVWPRVEEWFTSRFLSYWKDTEHPVLLNINRTQVMKRMQACRILEKSVVEIHTELERLISFYKSQSADTWIQWGFKIDTKRLDKLKQDGFYFGIYRNYEWIPRMFCDTIDHSCLDTQRKKIPKKVRHDVWDKRFSEKTNGICYCCEENVSIHEFHCGHILSVSDGGTNTLENLEVVCIKCNLDMSTMNMETYKILFLKK